MKMDVLQALMIAASGFLTVFLMLVILWLIIVLINKAVTSTEKAGAGKKAAEAAAQAEEPVKERPVYVGEVALLNVDEKTAACIMAIVSDQTKIPLSQLIFRSIRALD